MTEKEYDPGQDPDADDATTPDEVEEEVERDQAEGEEDQGT